MKTILIPFFDDEPAQAALECAARIADRFGGHLEALFVTRPPQIIDGEGMVVMAPYIAQLKEEGEQLAARARARFERFLAARGLAESVLGPDPGTVTASWRELKELEGRAVGDYGRLFDLVVIGREFAYPWNNWRAMCEAALFESGRPVMITGGSAPEQIGRRVVIAWNGSTETARTVAFGMPLLESAESVTVLSVEGWAVPGPGGDELARHLARNGIAVEARTVELGEHGAGTRILEACTSMGADLLVKGAYTHSRLRQLVFGGATQHIMQSAELPVLLAH